LLHGSTSFFDRAKFSQKYVPTEVTENNHGREIDDAFGDLFLGTSEGRRRSRDARWMVDSGSLLQILIC
jgi:hypothetical protein